ncbi:hypothetical protein, partial [Mixta calida]|uniref:hypothetical protein n=1 Tax=Mixta calida TaxID=665913 RepID=UPI0028969610
STSKTPSYTKSVSWQHHPAGDENILLKSGALSLFPLRTGKWDIKNTPWSQSLFLPFCFQAVAP